jgi:hypothetical protein
MRGLSVRTLDQRTDSFTGPGNSLTASLARKMVPYGGDGWHCFHSSVASNAEGVLIIAFDASGLSRSNRPGSS